MQALPLGQEHLAHLQQRLDRCGNARPICRELPGTAGKCALTDGADLQPEAAEQAANAVVDVPQLAHKQLPGGQEGTQLLGELRLHMHRPEPAGPHHLRDGARIRPVGLDRHGPGRRSQVPRLEQHDGQSRRPEPSMEPLRHGPGLQADAGERETGAAQGGRERFRLTLCLQLPQHSPGAVNNADAARLQRDVDPGIVGHLGVSLA